MAKNLNLTEEKFEQLPKREAMLAEARRQAKSTTVLTMQIPHKNGWEFGCLSVYEITARQTKKEKSAENRRIPADRQRQPKLDSRKRHEYLKLKKAQELQEKLEQNRIQTKQYEALARINGLERSR